MSAQAAQPHPHEVQDRELSLRQTATPGSEGVNPIRSCCLAGNTSLWLAKAVAYRRGFFPLLAGVAPEYEEIEFADEDALRAFVADRKRRNITVGQKAMGYARLFPDPAKLKRKTDVPSEDNSFSKQSLSKARIVRHETPELAIKVRDDSRSTRRST